MVTERRKNRITFIINIISSIIILLLICVNLNILKEIEQKDDLFDLSSSVQPQEKIVTRNNARTSRLIDISMQETNLSEQRQEEKKLVKPEQVEKVKEKPVYEMPLEDVILLQ